jgi:hypothetical protein
MVRPSTARVTSSCVHRFTCSASETGNVSTGTVGDFGKPHHTAYLYCGVVGIHGLVDSCLRMSLTTYFEVISYIFDVGMCVCVTLCDTTKQCQSHALSQVHSYFHCTSTPNVSNV